MQCCCVVQVGMTLHHFPHGLMCLPTWDNRAEELHLLLIFVFFYLIPLIIMTFTYVKVALVLWRSGSMNDTDGECVCV
jgi:hypothetical protein